MVALSLATLIGASLVLLGAGGSIITVPVLVFASGLDVHQAAGTSLLIVGLVALAGVAVRWRSVELGVGALVGTGGMVGAVGGAWLNHRTPEAVVLLTFALTLLVAARLLMRPMGTHGRRTGASPTAALGGGLAIGVATGFFGVGGGFLIVPVLTLALGLGMERAVATSLFVIALSSGAGLVAHLGYGAVEWRIGLSFAGAAMVGAALAMPIARIVSARTLQRAFATLLLVVGLAMLAETVRGIVI